MYGNFPAFQHSSAVSNVPSTLQHSSAISNEHSNGNWKQWKISKQGRLRVSYNGFI